MSWVRAVVVVFLLTIIPGTGWGADMNLGLEGSAEYDSNIYRTSAHEKGDAVFRITPKVHFIEDEGKFAALHRLDRVWVGYTGDKAVLRFGRQAISWGNGLIFSPPATFG